MAHALRPGRAMTIASRGLGQPGRVWGQDEREVIVVEGEWIPARRFADDFSGPGGELARPVELAERTPDILLQGLQHLFEESFGQSLLDALVEYRAENWKPIADVWLRVDTEVKTLSATTVRHEIPGSPLAISLGPRGIEVSRDAYPEVELPSSTQSDVQRSTYFNRKAGLYMPVETTTVTEKTFRLRDWFGPDTGILLFNRRGDDTFRPEDLLGTGLITGRKRANGFEDLAELDRDGNGVIDRDDPVYDKLRVWRDRGGKGRFEEGEILTLAEAGIDSIRVGREHWRETDDPRLRQRSTCRGTGAAKLEERLLALWRELRANKSSGLPPLQDLLASERHVDRLIECASLALARREQPEAP